MSIPTFDRLGYVDTLKNAGVPEPLARAHATALEDAFRDSVATQADVVREGAAVRKEIAAVEQKLTAEIAAVDRKVDAVKAELKADIAGVEQRLEVKIADVRSGIKEAKVDLLKVIIGAVSVNIVAMFGVAKLLGH